MWRWTGFNSGLDLIVTYDSFKLTLKASNDDIDDVCELQIDFLLWMTLEANVIVNLY